MVSTNKGSAVLEYVLATAVLLTASIIIEPAIRQITLGLWANLNTALQIPVL